MGLESFSPHKLKKMDTNIQWFLEQVILWDLALLAQWSSAPAAVLAVSQRRLSFQTGGGKLVVNAISLEAG
ncbi:hypothetical protein BTVI_92800 [Pitangus sulphuratus]|nr:hypothetical protein BTVI_92800 [Pitangus sulphuratus]